MKIQRAKLDEVVRNDEGEPFRSGDKDLTYAMAIRQACAAQMYLNAEGNTAAFRESGDDRYRIGMIVYKLKAKKHCALESKDVTLLKDRIEKLYNPSLIVRLFDVLEDKGAAEKRAAKENEEESESEA
jgi:hypothetical protein